MTEIWERYGLSREEYETILRNLKREPNEVELGIFGALWSEHCSYKSTRKLLKKFPTSAEWVVQGPGENAGVIKIDEKVWVAFKIESHNHPSYIEPFNGAATGVGGIIRDILSMGARPIALMDSLRFGEVDYEETERIVKGVVKGISSYGNSIGVPTVGGETFFDESYNTNPLVNAFCIGILPAGRIYRSKATKEGQLLFLIGSTTGRDGIHGAVMASSEFGEDTEGKRSNVQVGDPYFGKKLIEAVLEAVEKGIPVGMQDLGAGGLAGASSELAGKSGFGVEVFLDRVPLREEGMTPYEILLSESQERMLIVVEGKRVKELEDIAKRHQLSYAVVGKIIQAKRFRAFFKDEIVADIPIDLITEKAPYYERPFSKPVHLENLQEAKVNTNNIDIIHAIKKLLTSPNIASKEIIYSQYDYQVGTNTVIKPGSDASVLRLKWVEKPEVKSEKGIAISCEGNGRFVFLDPYEGGKYVVAEACRNVACVGAKPLAITDCLNFGNPEREEIMYQIVKVVEGMAEACEKLGVPVVSGNVSLYNETIKESVSNILPTPIVVCVGIIEDLSHVKDHTFKKPSSVFLIGDLKQKPNIAGSEFAKIFGSWEGRISPINLEKEDALIKTLVRLAKERFVLSMHDVSVGGLIVNLIESIVDTEVGINIELYTEEPLIDFLFCENPTRAVVSVEDSEVEKFKSIVEDSGLDWLLIGKVKEEETVSLFVNDEEVFSLKKDEVEKLWKDALKNLLGYT